ncbi:MAG TPA: signal peptidase I [Patescibacteria group bacterium]
MFSFIQSVVITVLLAFLLRFFVLQPFIVEGSSMEPNFHDQQYIIIDKLSYRMREPHRGEVIVFHPPVAITQNYIKRIIGLPGETVLVKEGEVFVNGKKVDEPYLGNENHHTLPISTQSPVTLGDDEYFVMGDNRTHSSDSREFGALKKANIEGRTWFIAFPFRDFEFIHKPNYNLSLAPFATKISLALKDLTN